MQYMIRLRDATGTFGAAFNADSVESAIDAAVAYCEETGREYLSLAGVGPDE